jgi:hypothetical protein
MKVKSLENGGFIYPQYYYKKALVKKNTGCCDSVVIWLEGVDQQNYNDANVGHISGFGIAGYPIWTNSGIEFNKEQLQKIIDLMPEDAILRVAGLTHRIPVDNPIEGYFEKQNGMVRVGCNKFAPPDYIPTDEEKIWMEQNNV